MLVVAVTSVIFVLAKFYKAGIPHVLRDWSFLPAQQWQLMQAVENTLLGPLFSQRTGFIIWDLCTGQRVGSSIELFYSLEDRSHS